ncbi:MAG: PEP-CTERM sorting domain-containing protein [Gemmatimonadetes bacterium]|nr:PEP-CTERM sorting domain-containing protein [Gemmatimonadota bacterium]
MRSTLAALLCAAAVAATPRTAAAQWQGPITFAGCDAARSCHTMQFFASTFDEHPGEMLVTFLGATRWIERGAFSDCGTGCAWNSNLPPLGSGLLDLRHASAFCWAYVDRQSHPTPVVSTGHLCGPHADDDWGGGGFRAPLDWRPQFVNLNLVYAEHVTHADGPPVPATEVSLQLALVPEPSTLLLLVIGGALLLLWRRGGPYRRG